MTVTTLLGENSAVEVSPEKPGKEHLITDFSTPSATLYTHVRIYSTRFFDLIRFDFACLLSFLHIILPQNLIRLALSRL